MAKKKPAKAISDEALANIRETITRWRPGGWAEEVDYGPACLCGVSERYTVGNKGYTKHGKPSGKCPAHSEGNTT